MSRRTARSVALEALLRMEEREGYSNLVIDQALRSSGLDPRDRALASALFYGVLERRLTLDWLLAHCLRDPGRKLDRTAQAALRCGAYQIWFMDRVPDAAAVNETVNALKATGKRGLAGFVNGTLRGLIRQKGSLSLPQGDDPASQSVRYSVPEGLIRLWREGYGAAFTGRWLESLTVPADTYIRANLTKTTLEDLAADLAQQGAVVTPLGFPPGAAKLEAPGSPAGLAGFQRGLFHVQDLSAQLVCALVGAQPGETVYDCCAAPGGKTFTLAQNVGEAGAVSAFDLRPGRVELIREGAKRLGLTNVSAQAADMTAPPPLPLADRVLCDAPCSGFGVIRRKPEVRYKDLEAIRELPELQSSLLGAAARLTRPGGRLVYATCSLNPAENAGVAERFLQERPDFQPAPVDLPGVGRAMDEPAHHWTLVPFAGASDGFFAAVFERKR